MQKKTSFRQENGFAARGVIFKRNIFGMKHCLWHKLYPLREVVCGLIYNNERYKTNAYVIQYKVIEILC